MNVLRKVALAGAMTGATLGGAALGATMIGTAGAQTSTTTPSADSSTATTAPADSSAATAPQKGDHAAGPHQANGKTETVLTGDDLAKVTAAVEQTVPGATIDRAETDADGAVYEAHITKSDGTKATVKFDANFTVTSVDAGMS